MNPRLQAHAERRRTQRLRTHHPRQPAQLPASLLATMWPPADLGLARPARWVWNTGRTTTAQCWPSGLDREQRPKMWRAARIGWTLTGLTIYAATAIVALAAVLTRPIAWVITNVVSYRLVTAGWSPPLTGADLADPNQALFDDDEEHTRRHDFQLPAPATRRRTVEDNQPVDGWDRERAAERRHERQTAALEALAHPPPPPPVAPYPVMRPTPVRRPVTFGRWVIRALITMSILSATGLLVAAWALTALSAAGTIPAPPTNDQLVESIHANTEARAADIAEQFNANDHPFSTEATP